MRQPGRAHGGHLVHLLAKLGEAEQELAGLIFVKSDTVKGLTTAATLWLVTGIGMSCGAGLLLLASVVTVLYFVVALVFPLLIRLIPGRRQPVEQSQGVEHE